MRLTPAQLKALSHPARSRILEALRHEDCLPASEIAVWIQEAAAYTHYHIRGLLEAGLIRVVGSRYANHRSERLFALVDPDMRLEGDPDSLFQFARQSLAACRKELESASQGPELGRAKFVRWVLRLSPEGMSRVGAVLDELRQLASEPEGEEAFSLTLALVPLPTPHSGPANG